jgi:uncharacterized protein (TIGR04255 family)
MRSTADSLEPHTDTTDAPLRRHYERPPVLEAVIDIQVDPPTDADLSRLAAMHKGEEERYPARESLMSSSFAVDASLGATVAATQELIGYRWLRSDRSAAVQVRRNGLAFSRLQPYDRWETTRDEARRLWDVYVLAIVPRKITRIAVRYINRIDLPSPVSGSLQEYLRVYPQIPDGFSRRMGGFVMRLEMPQTDIRGCTLILNQGRVEAPSPNVLSILLDLDVIQVVDIPATVTDELWSALEVLHARENTIFEQCITPQTRALFSV